MMGPKLLNKEKYRQIEIGEDFHNLCRLCLTRTNLKLNIWLEEGQRHDIQENILNCLSLIVKKEDSLPKFVCNSCIDKLEDFQDFRNMCHESETLLNEYLSSAREKHTRKSSFEKSPASQETAPTPASDTGFSPLEVFIKSEAESADPLVCEETILGNICPENQPYVKTETTPSLVFPYDDNCVDSKQSSEYMEETSVCKVESVSVDSWMHFEGTTPEVPIGQNVPVEESDNDASLLSEDKDMKYSVENADEVEGEVPDPTERYLNDSFVEGQMQDVPGARTHYLVSAEKLDEQEQKKDNAEYISREGKFEAEGSAKLLKSRAQTGLSKSEKRRKQYMCSFCNKVFSHKGNFINHTRVHNKEKPFNCSICNKDFAGKSNLTVHMRVHTKEKPFNCSICNKRYNHNVSLSLHMRLHTRDRPFICSICNKDFADKSSLTVHMRVHTKEKPFSCSICNKNFAHRCSFNLHMRLHTEEKPFNCSVCNKRFNRKESLNIHMRLHTKEKPFSCSICNKGFAAKGNLSVHMKLHTKEKPFNCSICSKGFAVKGNLTVHMRVHTKEKPFICSICNKRFNQKVNLNSHMRLHTK